MKLPSIAACFVISICTVIGSPGLVVVAQSKQTDDRNAPFSDQQIEFFENKVRPLLVEHCFQCHGPEAKPLEGGLSLQSRKAILAGGDTGPAISPGHPENSLLIDSINYGEVYEMPPDTKLAEKDIATLTEWVKQGAPWPSATDVDVAVKSEFDLQGRKAEHWCWRPVRRQVNIPEVENKSWVKNSIDNFILSGVEQANLTPAPAADRRTLIRRVYFDLIGLPPKSEQIEAFLNDTSTNAFEKVVDELLASERFGERWARHWMDLTRYAETGGHEFDYPIPYAFRYRDYLIRAFNADVPYRQLIHEHIAGDLIPKPRLHPDEAYDESILGTGFWFLGEAKHGAVDSRDEEARTIDNQIDVMSKTFLGLTVACARCHDHKFDAISTEDYYALAGFLQSSRRQAAMLDSGRRIEQGFEAAAPLSQQGDRLVSQICDGLGNASSETIASYLDAALTFLRSDPAWNQKAAIIIEGESLQQVSLSGGQSEIQTIKARGGFQWNGDKQYWWKHGKPNDVWELEFEVPQTPGTSRYDVSGVFTKAADYGAAKLSINNQVVVPQLDFYAPELTTTGVFSMGEMELKPGKNVLRLELGEHHENAIPANMVGIDYLKLVPKSRLDRSVEITVEKISAEKSVNVDLLRKLITAIQNPATQRRTHPLHLIFKASKSALQFDDLDKQIASEAKVQESRFNKWQESSTLFADFKTGIPTGWFRTGFALSADAPGTSPKFANAGPILNAPDNVHSGKLGGNYYGVLRSPTFKLDHENIHYRIRGSNVTIRLIIDGFTMDEFNALLYNGCKFDIASSEEFTWQTQAGDLKNHVGSRAHIEIIDHGSGYFSIDEIRFSNGAQASDPPTTASARSLAGGKFGSQADFCQSMAAAWKDLLAHPADSQAFEIASWIVENDLIEVFAAAGGSEVSNLERQPSDSQSVSFVAAGRRNDRGPALPALVEKIKAVRKQVDSINVETPAPQFGLAMTDGTGEEEYVFIRGNYKTPGDIATRRFLAAISPRPLNPPDGSGRLQLAYKMTAPNNPLTTRVAVNRVWHHMFGRGIVKTVDNFGVLGKAPTHPELLDYLAREFEQDGWSVKRLLKRIAMSSAYQMSSQPNPAAKSIDPDNQLLHRARIRRLQGEAIRDSILQISGRLDLKMFGPPIPIHLTSFMGGRGRPSTSGPLDGAGRRSVYVAVRRNFLSPMMLAFDTPIPFNATGKRNISNVPAQALIMMNDPFVIGQAEQWAKQLIESGQSTSDRIESIYLSALGRPATTMEQEQAESFLRIQASELKIAENDIESNVEIWRDLCHVMFNLKEFIYIN